ncbi:MAG TPA: hypothetical protein VFS43_12940 [Polyangiaceae bacterium]|nr:hypothetical protein [Polyangiaceae bacterium]
MAAAAFAAAALTSSAALGAPTAGAGVANARAALAPASAVAAESAPQGPRASEGWAGVRLGGRFSPQGSVLVSPPGREGAPKSSWRTPVGIAGLGVGAALLGAGVFSTVRLNGVESQWAEPSQLAYRASLRSPQEACDSARRGVVSPQAGAASPDQVRGLCTQASTFEALQYAFYGAGALVGGLGALLLLSAAPPGGEAPPTAAATAKRAQPPKVSWRLQPTFKRSSATLTLHVRF